MILTIATATIAPEGAELAHDFRGCCAAFLYGGEGSGCSACGSSQVGEVAVVVDECGGVGGFGDAACLGGCRLGRRCSVVG